jgi:hypothetical protein
MKYFSSTYNHHTKEKCFTPQFDEDHILVEVIRVSLTILIESHFKKPLLFFNYIFCPILPKQNLLVSLYPIIT